MAGRCLNPIDRHLHPIRTGACRETQLDCRVGFHAKELKVWVRFPPVTLALYGGCSVTAARNKSDTLFVQLLFLSGSISLPGNMCGPGDCCRAGVRRPRGPAVSNDLVQFLTQHQGHWPEESLFLTGVGRRDKKAKHGLTAGPEYMPKKLWSKTSSVRVFCARPSGASVLVPGSPWCLNGSGGSLSLCTLFRGWARWAAAGRGGLAGSVRTRESGVCESEGTCGGSVADAVYCGWHDLWLPGRWKCVPRGARFAPAILLRRAGMSGGLCDGQ